MGAAGRRAGGEALGAQAARRQHGRRRRRGRRAAGAARRLALHPRRHPLRDRRRPVVLHPQRGRPASATRRSSGRLLAMLVVLLFLGSLRKTFIIGLSIPLAVLATFVMMGLGHLTLNIMSLGGLALGVGLLIDNSIVMLENIFRHRQLGDRRSGGGGAPRLGRGGVRRGRLDADQPGRGGPLPAHHRAGGPHLPRADPDHLVRHRRLAGRRR